MLSSLELEKVFNQTSYKNNKSLLLLHNIVESIRPECVLEFGTGNGLSSIYMALGIGEGKIVTVDDYKRRDRSVIEDNINSCGVRDRIELLEGDTKKAGSFVKGITPKILFMDASHSSEDLRAEYDSIKGILPKEHLIIIDDSLTGSCKDFTFELSKNEMYKFTLTFNQLHFGMTLLGTSLFYIYKIKTSLEKETS